jgi:hypothetical protein
MNQADEEKMKTKEKLTVDDLLQKIKEDVDAASCKSGEAYHEHLKAERRAEELEIIHGMLKWYLNGGKGKHPIFDKDYEIDGEYIVQALP